MQRIEANASPAQLTPPLVLTTILVSCGGGFKGFSGSGPLTVQGVEIQHMPDAHEDDDAQHVLDGRVSSHVDFC